MHTPFDSNIRKEEYEITPSIIQTGYVSLQKIPDLSTLYVDIGECNSILSDAYIVEEITIDNLYLYPDVALGNYILTWNHTNSSSSSGNNQLEMKTLLESGLYTNFIVGYISTN